MQMNETWQAGAAGSRILQTLENIDHISASPEIILKVVRLFSDPDVDMREIAQYISKEQSISAQILRLANSAYFSRGMVISSISQAMVHLGLNIVKKVIIAFEMFDAFPGRSDDPSFNTSRFILSSMAGAMVSEELSVRLSLKDREEIYLCCLLRDFGVLVIKQYFPDIFKQICRTAEQKQCPFPVACSIVCGFDHRHIANILFQQWNLPSNILSLSEQGSAKYGNWLVAENILNYVDWTLKHRNFGQWDPFANPVECGAETFALDENELNAAVNQRLMEADEFMTMLSGSLGEARAA